MFFTFAPQWDDSSLRLCLFDYRLNAHALLRCVASSRYSVCPGSLFSHARADLERTVSVIAKDLWSYYRTGLFGESRSTPITFNGMSRHCPAIFCPTSSISHYWSGLASSTLKEIPLSFSAKLFASRFDRSRRIPLIKEATPPKSIGHVLPYPTFLTASFSPSLFFNPPVRKPCSPPRLPISLFP